jgi:hypothetical protein
MDARYKRIEANCKIIWGDRDYDFEVEGGGQCFADDDVGFQIYVRKDHGTEWGPNLTMTPLYKKEETCWSELDRVLKLHAEEVLMTRSSVYKDLLQQWVIKDGKPVYSSRTLTCKGNKEQSIR